MIKLRFPTFALPERHALLRAVLLVLGIKLLWLLPDPNVRLFLGDSGSYLHTAFTGWIPPDRSFLYGWMIGATAVPAQSMFTLLLLQTVFGAASALLLYAWLRFGLATSVRVATLAAVLFATEPAQVFYERMVMAEATGFIAFALMFVCASLYVRGGRWHWAVAYVAFGVLTVSMRVSLMPVVMVFGLLAPVVRTLFGGTADAGRPLVAAARLALHLAVVLALTAGMHGAYKRWYGTLSQTEPAYIAYGGIFRLGLVLPLVKAEHFRDTGVDGAAVLGELTLPLTDPRSREAQLWTEGGILDVLRRHTQRVDAVAGKVSIRAVRDDPFGLVRMGASTLADYFDPAVVWPRLQNDLGRVPPSESQIAVIRTNLRYDVTGVAESDTPATRWFTFGAPWLIACLFLLAPLALGTLWAGWRAPGRDLRVLLCLASLGLVAQQALFSHIVSFRYLHAMPWFVLANVAVSIALLVDRRNVRR